MNRTTILALILVLVAVIWGYYYFFSGSPSSDADTGLSTPYAEEISVRLAELERVNNVSLNFTIFDSKLFQALRPAGAVATSTLIRGRINPFLPF
ncbi:MAG: hypothetical protein HYT40_01405 [Candidatus Sungbacteria bacterium]|uniref:Uncharacterized protein n=1 Tax=Candidatus Sungiibacteriota bacterium TaxID=2750080 RepID=A0A931SB94_9BACT|nr:hypothetical protein [Candidatus Sungbacteria bacterium]